MRIAATYSHQNGLARLYYDKLDLWEEIQEVIANVDAASCKTKVSQEKRTMDKLLYSPEAMNKAFSKGFSYAGWTPRRHTFWVTADETLMREIYTSPPEEQKKRIQSAEYEPIMSYNQTDFVKNGVAVEVQFGKYAFVAHDLFVKHLSFYISGIIQVGIEILPMKELEREMSSGVPYYERDLLNIIRLGPSALAVPIVLVGIAP